MENQTIVSVSQAYNEMVSQHGQDSIDLKGWSLNRLRVNAQKFM